MNTQQIDVDNTGEIDNVGMDWLTYVTTEKAAGRELYTACVKQATATEPQPEFWKRWSSMGYRGHSVDGLKFGTRNDDGCIAVFSGNHAVNGLRLTGKVEGRATRLDLQVTFLLTEANNNLAEKTYSKLEAINETRHRPRYISLIKSATGQTLYVGKRTGRIMLRLYDKTHQVVPGELGRYWRYEVEYKREAARAVYDKLTACNADVNFVLGTVGAEFSKRESEAAFSKNDKINAIEIGATVTTADQKLKWLVKCVAPVISQLSLAGFDEQIIEALRLRDIIVKFRGDQDGSK